MKKAFILAGLLLTGCAAIPRQINVAMFPAAGPFRNAGIVQSLKGRVTGIGLSGDFIFGRPDAVTCKGRWTTLPTQPTTTSLITQYRDVIGIQMKTDGMIQGLVLGSCSNNATFEAEYYVVYGTDNGFGVASDSDGNIYKLIF